MSIETLKRSMTTGQAIEAVRQWGIAYNDQAISCTILDVMEAMSAHYDAGLLNMKDAAAFEIFFDEAQDMFAQE
jgi:hypothetical protein